jgi:hypothetical protein
MMSDYESLSLVDLRQLYTDKVNEAVKLGLPNERFAFKPFFKSREEATVNLERVESCIRAVHESLKAIAAENGEEFDNLVLETKEKFKSKPIEKGNRKVSKELIPGNAVITRLVEENPKSRGAAVRFDFYYSGMTVDEYVEKVGDRTKALADIKWDAERGWISWTLATEQAA